MLFSSPSSELDQGKIFRCFKKCCLRKPRGTNYFLESQAKSHNQR